MQQFTGDDMRELEKIILEEIESFDEMRLLDIIAFIRYLKGHRPPKQKQITDWFEQTLKEITELKGETKDKSAGSNIKTQRRGKI